MRLSHILRCHLSHSASLIGFCHNKFERLEFAQSLAYRPLAGIQLMGDLEFNEARPRRKIPIHDPPQKLPFDLFGH
jgi:hypothetical protein